MKSLIRRRLKFQIAIISQSSQRTVYSHTGLRVQSLAQPLDLRWRQVARRIQAQGTLPSSQRVELDAADFPPLKRLDLRGILRDQEHPIHPAEIRDHPAQRGANLARLVRYPLGLAFHKLGIAIYPSRRPVLDLDDPNPRRADGNNVDFV